MPALRFRQFGLAKSGVREIHGAGWICDSGLVVTCMHCVSFDGKRWAVDEVDGAGEYALIDGDHPPCLLDPVLAIPSLDVAVLELRNIDAHSPADDARGHSLHTSLDWLPERVPWYADATPRQFDGQTIRLSGTLARWSAKAHQPHQLTVLQGTDVDWASVSGSPVLHDDRVVGMLRMQLDAGNTCFATSAYAIELALWVARRRADLAMLRPIGVDKNPLSRPPRESDRLAELLIAEGATPKDLEPKLNSSLGDTVRKTLDMLFRDRPLPSADSAEQDLCRRSLRALRSTARSTSDRLLRMVFSSADVSSDVFVAPRFRVMEAIETLTSQPPRSRQTDDNDKNEASDPSISYEQLINRLTGSKSRELHRIAVLGEAGSGKSTLLAHLAQEILERGWGLAISFHFQQLGNAGLMQAIEERWLAQMDITNSKELYVQAVQRLARGGKLWIFIDGIDEVGLTHREPLEQVSRSFVGALESTHVLVASRHAYWYHGTNDLHGFRIYDLEAFTPERVFRFIDRWFVAKPEVGAALAGKLKEPLRAYLLNAVRNPLRLAMLCALWSHRTRDAPDHSLPTTRAELYEQFLGLIYDWNLRRPMVGAVDRDALMTALSRLALHVLSHPSADDPDHAGSFGDDAISLSNPGVATDVRNALVEIGWVVRDGMISPTRRRLRFAHRTWLEYFAARGLSKGTELLDLESSGGSTRFLESGWREVVLFWMGRADVAVDEKGQLLRRVVSFRDRMWGVYASRALLLVPACLRECDCLSELETYAVVQEIMRQAVGFKDEAGQMWLSGFPAFQAAARAALVDAEPRVVSFAAWSAAMQADELPDPPTAFWQAMATTLSLVAGTDREIGRLAANILLDPWAQGRIRVEAAPFMRNPTFVKELKAAARMGVGERKRALQILADAATDSPEAADAAYRLLRGKPEPTSEAKQTLLRVLWKARRPSRAMVRFLEKDAFAAGTVDREWWLRALSASTSRPNALARRLWASLTDPSNPSDGRGPFIETLASLDDVPEGVVRGILAARPSWMDPELRWSGFEILRKASCKYPRLLRIIFDDLHREMHERWVADALNGFKLAQADSKTRVRLVEMLQSLHPSTRFEAARLTLELRNASETERDAALETLDELVSEFSLPGSRILETPWRAARLLRDRGIRRPRLVERVMAAIRSTEDDDARAAGMGVLADIGSGSTRAAQLLMDILEGTRGHANLPFAALRAIEGLGLPLAEDRSRLLTVGWELRDSDLVRWLLDCLSAWQIAHPAAAKLAGHVISHPTTDQITMEAAIRVMQSVPAFRERGVTLVLKVLESPDAKRREVGYQALKSLATPNDRVTLALLRALKTENNQWFFSIEKALDVQVAGKAQGAIAIPTLKRLLSQDDQTPGSNERQRVANELLLQIASRTPYLEFKACWNTEELLS